jgi:hypothetical protein
MFLRVNRKNTTFSLLAAACVFLRRKNFLRYFLRVHYFWAVLYIHYLTPPEICLNL